MLFNEANAIFTFHNALNEFGVLQAAQGKHPSIALPATVLSGAARLITSRRCPSFLRFSQVT
jgi:hypothetical protein